jgi:hypothetical protein
MAAFSMLSVLFQDLRNSSGSLAIFAAITPRLVFRQQLGR